MDPPVDNPTTDSPVIPWSDDLYNRVDQSVMEYNDEIEHRRSRKGNKRAQNHALTYGYDARTYDNQLSLPELSEIISNATALPEDGQKSILFFWARGNLRSGDELKMLELGIPSYVILCDLIFRACQILISSATSTLHTSSTSNPGSSKSFPTRDNPIVSIRRTTRDLQPF